MTGGGTEGVVGGEDEGGGAVVEEFEEGGVKIGGKGGTKLISSIRIRKKQSTFFSYRFIYLKSNLLKITKSTTICPRISQPTRKDSCFEPKFDPR